MSGNPLIVDRLYKTFGKDSVVIKDLNHTFQPGSATGLLGSNGSGKTTLLRLLGATSFPTSGSVLYGDLAIHERPYAYLRRVGIVHDTPSLPDYLTAVEILEYVLRSRSSWDERGRGKVDSLLDSLLLDDRRHNLIGTYSSGMIKKTQLALALAPSPSVLLLDEPLRGLDEDTLAAVLGLLGEFKATGGMIVIASHLKDKLGVFCDDYIDLDS